MLGGPRAYQSLHMSFPGLDSSVLCGCCWCKSHSTLMNFLINPSLDLFPSSDFWDEDRCALCGAIVHLWSASTTSVAETCLLSNTSHSSEDAHCLCSWEPEHSWATEHLPAPSSDFGRGGQLCLPCSSWFRVDPCKTGQAGNRERIQSGRCLKDKHFWEHQLFPHKYNTWWRNSNLFSPSTPVLWNECHPFHVAQTHNNELCFYRLPGLIAMPPWELAASFMALLHIISPSTFPALPLSKHLQLHKTATRVSSFLLGVLACVVKVGFYYFILQIRLLPLW